MARRALYLLFIIAFNNMLSPGCTVKEDRGLCPAVLKINLPPGDGEVCVSLVNPEGERVTHTVVLQDVPSVAGYPVCRDPFILLVSTGRFEEGGLLVPEGQQCSELYVHREMVHVSGETVEVQAVLEKEFCRLEVSVVSQFSGPDMSISGDWCGQELDGALVSGRFRTPVASGGVVRVPRQGDSSLMLDVRSGQVTRSFAIGEYMAEASYDWEEASLQDISIKVDFVRSRIQLRGNAWSQIFPIKIEL